MTEHHKYTNIIDTYPELFRGEVFMHMERYPILSKVIINRMALGFREQVARIMVGTLDTIAVALVKWCKCDISRLIPNTSIETIDANDVAELTFGQIISAIPSLDVRKDDIAAAPQVADFYRALTSMGKSSPNLKIAEWARDFAISLCVKYLTVMRATDALLKEASTVEVIKNKEDVCKSRDSFDYVVYAILHSMNFPHIGASGVAKYLNTVFGEGDYFEGIDDSEMYDIDDDNIFEICDMGSFGGWVRDEKLFRTFRTSFPNVSIKTYIHSVHNDFIQMRYLDANHDNECIYSETTCTSAVVFVDVMKLEEMYSEDYAKALVTIALYEGNYSKLPAFIVPSLSQRVVPTPIDVDEFRPVFIPVRPKVGFEDVDLTERKSSEFFDVWTLDTSEKYFGIRFDVLGEEVVLTDEYIRSHAAMRLPRFNSETGEYESALLYPPTYKFEAMMKNEKSTNKHNFTDKND